MPIRSAFELPSAETCARIALCCAGLSGNPHVGRAIRTTGTALDLITAIWDHRPTTLSPNLTDRIRILGHPAAVAAAIDTARQLDLRLIGPDCSHWPARLHQLGAGAPLLLWISGNPALLNDPPVVVTGATRPDVEVRAAVIDLTTRIADDGWTLAASTRPGVDQLTRDAARAMNGRLVTVAGTARLSDDPDEVVVSENPPLVPVLLGSAVRTPILLAVLGAKVVVGSPWAGTGAGRTCLAAHVLGRPLGRLQREGRDAAGGVDYGHRYGAPVVRSVQDVERLR